MDERTKIAHEIKAKRAEIRVHTNAIREIENEIAELKKGFNAEWKVGDRYETAKGAFEVMQAPVDDEGRVEGYRLQVAKIKKDGTPSESWQYPYGLENAKRIEA